MERPALITPETLHYLNTAKCCFRQPRVAPDHSSFSQTPLVSQQKIAIFLSLIFFSLSAAFGAYIYRQFEAYYQDTISSYDSMSVRAIGTPKLSHGVSDSGKLIRLYYPNGGSRLASGVPYTIFWEYRGTTDFTISLKNVDPGIPSVKIVRVVYKDKEPTATLQRGIYSWNVGELADGSMLAPGAGWRVVVADTAEADVFDESDSFFAIVR